MIGRTDFFVFLYGAVAVVGLLLSFFWGRYSWHRCRDVAHPCWKDRAFVMAAGITVFVSGATIDYASRAYGNIQYGLSTILKRQEGYVIAIGLMLVLIGAFILTWLADLEKHPPKWGYLGGAVILTLLWGGVTLWLGPRIPFVR